jgi:DNA adenine methylase
VGNKQRFAHEIISYFPTRFETYFEPFLGSGGVLASLAPKRAVGSDVFAPLIEIWQTLKGNPDRLKKWYSTRWHQYQNGNNVKEYEKIKASYNQSPNGADLLFLSRSCYGGIVRFRQTDGYMSTPCGPHNPISPESFSNRVDEWAKRVTGAEFLNLDFEEAFYMARKGDLIYCDPPYSDSQSILYGAQSFSLERLFDLIAISKEKGVHVALSIDGTKKIWEKEG